MKMNTIKKEYEAPQAMPIEIQSGLNILIQFSMAGDIDEITEGDSEWQSPSSEVAPPFLSTRLDRAHEADMPHAPDLLFTHHTFL